MTNFNVDNANDFEGLNRDLQSISITLTKKYQKRLQEIQFLKERIANLECELFDAENNPNHIMKGYPGAPDYKMTEADCQRFAENIAARFTPSENVHRLAEQIIEYGAQRIIAFREWKRGEKPETDSKPATRPLSEFDAHGNSRL